MTIYVVQTKQRNRAPWRTQAEETNEEKAICTVDELAQQCDNVRIVKVKK